MDYSDELAKIRQEYDRLDRLCGVDTSGIKLTVSSRARRQLGLCVSARNGLPKEIRFATILFESDSDTIIDTARHEYAHALVKIRDPKTNHNHDNVWKAACVEVGANPSRVSKPNKVIDAYVRDKSKYFVQCESCGHRVYYQRAGRCIDAMLHPRRYTGHVLCGACNSDNLSLYVRSKNGEYVKKEKRVQKKSLL